MEFDENLNPIEPPLEPDWRQTPPPPASNLNHQTTGGQPTPPPSAGGQTNPSWQTPTPPKPPVTPPPRPSAIYGESPDRRPASGQMIKRLMDLLTIAVVIVLVVVVINVLSGIGGKAAPTPSLAQQGLTVTGEGQAYVTPDVAKIDFGVSTEARNLADSQKINSEAIARIKDALQAYKIEAQDIKTLYYTINPEYNYINNRAPILRGYTTRHTVRITVRRLEDADSVVQTLGNSGATEISQVQFTVDDPSEIQKEAREKAIDAAKEKARQLADLSGAKLGRIISINESTPTNDGIVPRYAEGMGGGSGIGLEEGSMAITSHVTITYDLT